MNRVIVENFQELVAPEDTVFFLGDIFMFDKKYYGVPKLTKLKMVRALISQLPGKKILIRGNHDRGPNLLYIDLGFDEVHVSYRFKKDRIILFHDPKHMNKSGAPNDGKWRWIVGHVHDSWLTRPFCVNVSVDMHDFKPILLLEALSLIKGK